jgi:hypothetical protein
MKPGEPTREQLRRLARMVADTAPSELDCEAVLDRLAALLERGAGELDEELGRVKQHLSVCPECLEEFEALEALHREGALGEEG